MPGRIRWPAHTAIIVQGERYRRHVAEVRRFSSVTEMSAKRPPTLEDVAAACGVSMATVSYAISGKKKLSPETLEKVAKAVRRLNYHPNAVARGLQQRRVNMLGVLFGRINPAVCMKDAYLTGVLAGVMHQAQHQGFNIALYTGQWGTHGEPKTSLRDGRTDGILALAPNKDWDLLEGLAASGVPIVSVAGVTKMGVTAVDVDNYTGARLATEHLLGLGHRRIGYLRSDVHLSCYVPRGVGFTEALAAAGLQAAPELTRVCYFNRLRANEATAAMLASENPPTAIFAANDTMAFGALDAARAAGVRVPEDLSIVGFDDIPAAANTLPALTTVRQPLQAIGEKAAALLIQKICEPDTAMPLDTALLPPELVVRDSTAVCKR